MRGSSRYPTHAPSSETRDSRCAKAGPNCRALSPRSRTHDSSPCTATKPLTVHVVHQSNPWCCCCCQDGGLVHHGLHTYVRTQLRYTPCRARTPSARKQTPALTSCAPQLQQRFAPCGERSPAPPVAPAAPPCCAAPSRSAGCVCHVGQSAAHLILIQRPQLLKDVHHRFNTCATRPAASPAHQLASSLA